MRRSKYNAKRTEVDGITFHSAKESRRYQELCLLQQAGEIRDLKLQVSYPLVASDAYDEVMRDTRRIGEYRADFWYHERAGDGWRTVIEDVKGYDTPLSKWKRKHVLAQYGLEVRLT